MSSSPTPSVVLPGALRLLERYRSALEDDVMPFWTRNALDEAYGGYTDYLDRAGVQLASDKGGWVQGRAAWVYSELYRTQKQDPVWYHAAESGARFIQEHLIRADGRTWFETTREGKPLIMRRYLFTEMFAAIGLAAWSRISGDADALGTARVLFDTIERLEGTLKPKTETGTRKVRGHSHTMMMISLCQEMRAADPANAPRYNTRIDHQIAELFEFFVKPGERALLEVVNEDGSRAHGPQGRLINPGHAIETAWFLLEEAGFRPDQPFPHLTSRALEILSWNIELGWDTEYGGIFSFLDVEGRQPAQIEWDMKYWWPHCEALYATLLAYRISGEHRYLRWFEMVDDYTWHHFPDPLHGEWFGYLRRDGSVASTVKGNHFKGPFHIPRMINRVWRLLGDFPPR